MQGKCSTTELHRTSSYCSIADKMPEKNKGREEGYFGLIDSVGSVGGRFPHS